MRVHMLLQITSTPVLYLVHNTERNQHSIADLFVDNYLLINVPFRIGCSLFDVC